MARCVDFLVPNESEAERLTGLPVCDVEGARAAAHALIEQGYPTVVVTLGAQGALWVDRNGTFHVPAFPVEVVDTTAAGDSFIGALGVAIGEHRPPAEVLRFAAAAAALSVTRLGAQSGIPTRARLDAFLAS
jgi:ribokinase